MSSHQHDQTATDKNCQKWHCDRSQQAPDDECMPFPLPDIANQSPRMMAQVLQLLAIKWKAPCVKEMNTQLEERKKQKEMKRGHRLCPDLRCHLVETKCPCEQNHHDRSDANGRVYSDDYS
jgi:hypothetical protein